MVDEMSSLSGPPARVRRRPQMNLSGMGLLVVGVAVACWALRPLGPGQDSSGQPRPPFDAGAIYQAAGNAWWIALAASVAVLIRRARSGGYPRPGEWLAFAIVLDQPHWPLHDLMARVGSLPPVEVGGLVFPISLTAIGLVLPLAGLLVFIPLRGSVPGRAKTPLAFAGGVLLVWGALSSIRTELYDFFWLVGGISPGSIAWVGPCVGDLVVAIPLTATLLDFCRRDRPDLAWTEWFGTLAALLLGLGWLLEIVFERLAPRLFPGTRVNQTPLHLGQTLLAYAFALFLVRALGPALGRWLAAGRGRP